MTRSHLGAIAVAAFGFGCISVLARLSYQAGSRPESLLAARLVLAAVLLAPLAVRGSPRMPSVPSLAGAVGAGAALAAGGLLEFEALARLPALATVTVLFLAPVWIALATWARRGERPTRRAVAALAAVLGGIMLLVGTPAEWTLDGAGLGMAVGASFLFATVFLLLEDLVRREAPATAIARVVVAAAIVPAAAEHQGLAAELTRPATAAYGVAVGALTAGSLLLLALGMEATPAFPAAVITATEPVAAAVLSALLLGEVLAPTQMLGALGMVAGAIAISAGARHEH